MPALFPTGLMLNPEWPFCGDVCLNSPFRGVCGCELNDAGICLGCDAPCGDSLVPCGL